MKSILRSPLALACGLLALGASAPAAAVCGIESVRQALPVRQAGMAPLSAELPGGPSLPGFVEATLGRGSGESLALDRVLLRQRLANCVVDEFAGYKPRTEFDNTPWRFNAGGEGKKFSAAEFDAWMKKRGIRVAKGRQDAGSGGADATPASAPIAQ